jgi:hypothetical protein
VSTLSRRPDEVRRGSHCQASESAIIKRQITASQTSIKSRASVACCSFSSPPAALSSLNWIQSQFDLGGSLCQGIITGEMLSLLSAGRQLLVSQCRQAAVCFDFIPFIPAFPPTIPLTIGRRPAPTMARKTTALFLALGFLVGTSQALNPLFLAMGAPQCDTCQDQAYNTCPGDHLEMPFAECMCAGKGGEVYSGSCIPLCTDATQLGAEYFAISLLTYCIQFFPEYCETAKFAGVTDSIWEEHCGAGANAGSPAGGSGSGSSGSGSGSSGGSASGSGGGGSGGGSGSGSGIGSSSGSASGSNGSGTSGYAPLSTPSFSRPPTQT